MSGNPFISLLEEFRSAAANLNTLGFGFAAWSQTPASGSGQRVLGLCQLPVRIDDKVEDWAFTVAVDVFGTHAECGAVFADLASRAGAALPAKIRFELAKHCPEYVTEMAPWWFAFLWRLFLGRPVELPVREDTGRRREGQWPVILHRPFLLSATAIDMCRLNTDSPGFPPKANTGRRRTGASGGSQSNGTEKSPREKRDKWIYDECMKGTPYQTIGLRLKRKPKSWPEIGSPNGIKTAAGRYAERHSLPKPPARQSGRRSG